MGRGRKGLYEQSLKKEKGTVGPLPRQDRYYVPIRNKPKPNQTIVVLPEEVLKELGQMNPRDVANILVN